MAANPQARSESIPTVKLLINGQFVESKAKAWRDVVNPATQQVYVLIRKDLYDLTCGIVGGGPGRVWDDEADDDLIADRDLIRKRT